MLYFPIPMTDSGLIKYDEEAAERQRQGTKQKMLSLAELLKSEGLFDGYFKDSIYRLIHLSFFSIKMLLGTTSSQRTKRMSLE